MVKKINVNRNTISGKVILQETPKNRETYSREDTVVQSFHPFP